MGSLANLYSGILFLTMRH